MAFSPSPYENNATRHTKITRKMGTPTLSEMTTAVSLWPKTTTLFSRPSDLPRGFQPITKKELENLCSNPFADPSG